MPWEDGVWEQLDVAETDQPFPDYDAVKGKIQYETVYIGCHTFFFHIRRAHATPRTPTPSRS